MVAIWKNRYRGKLVGNQRGFTLIELIVVMAILALLAGLVVPRFLGILNDSEGKADLANKEMLRNAVELYEVNEGEDPASLDVLVSEGYIKAVPVNPVTGNPYTLEEVDV